MARIEYYVVGQVVDGQEERRDLIILPRLVCGVGGGKAGMYRSLKVWTRWWTTCPSTWSSVPAPTGGCDGAR
jgi:hypothetical protein